MRLLEGVQGHPNKDQNFNSNAYKQIQLFINEILFEQSCKCKAAEATVGAILDAGAALKNLLFFKRSARKRI